MARAIPRVLPWYVQALKMTESKNPEIARSVITNGFSTNYHDLGNGPPVLLIHGSGPGVTAWANWRLTMPELAKGARVLAPDMVGFGYTERPAGIEYTKDEWVKQAIGFLDALGVERTDVIGNSFGGGIALAMAIRHPERVRRIVLMGAAGVRFELTPALNDVWGYTPSMENMRDLMRTFSFNDSFVNDDLAQLRYLASIRPGVQEAFSVMFPAPRQRWIDALASAEEEIRSLSNEVLIVHGREDRVVPVSSSQVLAEWIRHAQLHVFGCCGHWVQIEHAARFNRLTAEFLAEAG
jgi:2-hydroxymuconate-semialdehyde hydrolase